MDKSFRWVLLVSLLFLSQVGVLGYPVDIYYPQGFSNSGSSLAKGAPFVLSTPHYELKGDPANGVLCRFSTKRDGRGAALMALPGMSIETVAASKVSSSSFTRDFGTRLRVTRNGPIYNELVIKDIPVAADATAPALTADVVLHCYSEKTHVVVTIRANQDISPDQVLIRMPLAEDSVRYLTGSGRRLGIGSAASLRGPEGFLLEGADKSAVCALTVPAVDPPEAVRLERGSNGVVSLCLTMSRGASKLWRAGESHRMCFALLFPTGNDRSLRSRIKDETRPDLMIEPIGQDIPGFVFKGYQSDKGFYLLDDPESRPESYHGVYPYSIPQCLARVMNPSHARNAYICLSRMLSSAQLSGLPVITDKSWLPTGEQVQLSRKWEREKTPSYAESYFSLGLDSKESRVIGYREPRTWWGEFPAVQMSSLDLSEYFDWAGPWWHCSMGESEFICYEFHRNDIANIADFRPIDGPKLGEKHSEHSWFRNAGGGEFLKYQFGDKWQALQQKHLRFVTNGPNLVYAVGDMFTLDGRASAKVEIIQPPCRDYNRVFFRLKYSLKGGIPIGDLRLFGLEDEDYPVPHQPQSFGYLAENGEVIAGQSAWDGRAIRLHKDCPFVFLEGDSQGRKGALIRSVRGRIGGTDINDLMVRPISAEHGQQKQILALVPDATAKETSSGDYAEIEIELVGWGAEYAPTWMPMLVERKAYSPKGLRCEVLDGVKKSDFPIRVRPEPGKQHVELVLSGGRDVVPILVEGISKPFFGNHRQPVVYELLGKEWVLLGRDRFGNDSWQVVKENGAYTFVLPISTDGRVRRLIIGPKGMKLPAAPKNAKRLDATIVGSKIPHIVFAKQALTLCWSVKNTGKTTWKAGDVFVEAEGFFGHQRFLAKLTTGTVTSGSVAAFTVRVSPNWSGAENEISKTITARVVRSDGSRLSNEWVDWIRLLNWPDGAEFVSDTIPARMMAGQTRDVEISMRNVGSAEWSESARHCVEVLGAFDEKSRYVYPAPGERVLPGQVWTARVQIQAPSEPGRYRTRWVMNHRDVAWFGPMLERTISIAK